MTTTNDLTKGKVSDVFLSFFFPMLFTNLLQQLYIFADNAIVGKGLGDNSFAAVGNMSSLTLLIIGFVQGVANGFSVVIAHKFGSRDISELKKSIAESIRLSVIISLILTIISIKFLKDILIVMKTDEVIMGESLIYGCIIFGGLTITMAYNLCSAVLRALGDSKTPFVAIVISSGINIILDCLFIFVMKTGVGGAAVATVIAQAVSVVICIIRLKKTEEIKLTLIDFRAGFLMPLNLLKNGIPMAFMNSVTAIGCIIVQSCVNDLGVEYTTAYSACNKYINLFMLPSVTAGFALSAFVSQNFGAKKYDRIRKGVSVSLVIGVVSYAVLGILMVFFPQILARVLINGQKPIELATNFLRICGSMFFALNFLFVFRSTVQGMGKPLVPMLSGILEMGIRIFIIIKYIGLWGFESTAYAEILAWIGALALNFTAYLIIMRNKERVSEQRKTSGTSEL